MSKRVIRVDEKLPLAETIPLSLQHLFAMFGSTVLVPMLFKVNPATVLLFNGIGTILYLILCRKGRFVELADGIKRTAAAPKKKNVLHLHLVSKKMPGFESGLPGDEEIARFLRSLDKAETDSKHL